MSADDYVVCPVCNGLPERLRNISKMYGKIPEAEYTALRAEAEEASGKDTVRVYRDFTLYDDLTVSFTLSAECEVCGAKWSKP